MNCTLRVITATRRIVVKQGRPWVEKYPHMPAPADRTLVEAAFYRAVARHESVASRMPALLHVDEAARIIVLEDVAGPDLTGIYSSVVIDAATVHALVDYLIALHDLRIGGGDAAIFANREMRALNHQHIFRFPLAPSNGLDLDSLTPGLQRAADALKRDAPFVDRVTSLGDRYLANGAALVHGDFFPGSWLASARGPVVIDPEFCFTGAPEFDFGVMMAHLIVADQPSDRIDWIAGAIPTWCDRDLIDQFAGVEIMRRLIGVAQLPLDATLARKQACLDRARTLVLS
jgi:5-methylthioribose kinase